MRVTTCFSLSGLAGVGRGVGCVGVGVGAWVTKVIVCGAASAWFDAVLAVGPTVTWYCVLGARFPLVGCTASVRLLLSQENVTVVAGEICTASWVVWWSIG